MTFPKSKSRYLMNLFFSSLYSVIVRVRIVLKRTVVADWRFDNQSHLQSQVNGVRYMWLVSSPSMVLVDYGQSHFRLVRRVGRERKLALESSSGHFLQFIYGLARRTKQKKSRVKFVSSHWSVLVRLDP